MVGMAWLVEWSVGWHGIFNEEILLVHFFTELCVVFCSALPSIHSLSLKMVLFIKQWPIINENVCGLLPRERGVFPSSPCMIVLKPMRGEVGSIANTMSKLTLLC